MSSDRTRPRNVQFVDVTARGDKDKGTPAWLHARPEEPLPGTPEYAVAPLAPPEVPSHARPAQAPLLESVWPAAPRPPSQFPGPKSRPPPASYAPPRPSQPPGRPPSQFPAHAASSQPPLQAAPSQFPGGGGPAMPSQFPGLGDSPLAHDPGGPGLRRRDTLVEDLVPRAEEEAVQAIKAAITEFAEQRARALEGAEKELIELVRVICRRVVLREVSLSSSVVEALVQEGLSALGKSDKIWVKLGPFFADALEHISENLHHHGIDCSVVIDADVGAHGCVVETQLGRVDESVETRLGVLLASLDTAP